MDLEVFEGAETVEQAVAAAKRARMLRFQLFADMQSGGNRRALLAHHDDKAQHKYANQINQAINGKGGFPEHMARRAEEAVGLPFGWLDQPFPVNELRASRARAKRLLMRIVMLGDEAKQAVGPRTMDMIYGGISGERGVSRDLYAKVLKKLKLSK